MKNKFAFTLAEVLITLTIIGVIAALTIPNLMQKYQEHATVNKVKKFYSTLTRSYTQAIKENGMPDDEWGLTGTDEASAKKVYEILFKPYFKIAKDCGTNNNGNCIDSSGFKTRKSGEFIKNDPPVATTKGYKILLSDGSAVYWYVSTTKIPVVRIDMNGSKIPNQLGVDIFQFVVPEKTTKERMEPEGLPSYSAKVSFDNNCAKSTHQGWGCAAWVVYKGNMDYLHCSDLTWNGKNKCK